MTDLIGDYLSHHRPWRPVVDGNWQLGRDIATEEELVVPGDTAKEGRAGATSTSEQTVFERGEGE
jgi:hypothetical protein